MRKACKVLAQVAGRFLFIGISVQIIFGIVWGIRSFGIFPEFGDSYLWLKAARTLVCDDYMGIGYPLFLMLAKGIESISSIPYTFFVYFVQCVFAFVSGAVFLRSFGVIKKSWMLYWGSLGMLTFPMALQCHLAVLPNSIGFSCLLMELAAVIRILRLDGTSDSNDTDKAQKDALQGRPLHMFFETAAWWVIGALFVVENRYLGLVPVVLLWIFHLIQRRKTGKTRILQELVLLAAMGGILFTLVSLWQTPGSYGKAENTISAAMMRRFSWTHMREGKEYEAWPEELREHLSWEEVKNAGYYAGTMSSGIQKTIEDAVGKQEAQKLFRKYASYNLKTYASDNIHQIAWDCAGYALPPMLLQLLLDGRGYDSFSGRNVDIYMTGSPRLVNIMLKYSSWWFLMGIPAMILSTLCCMFSSNSGKFREQNDEKISGQNCRNMENKKGKRNVETIQIFIICIVTAGCMILWYAMQDAGCFDYKNGLLPGCLWLVGMILSVGKVLKEKELEETSEEKA